MTDAEKLELYRRILQHTMPEKSGMFFICGSGPIGDDGLPDHVSICPGYGADWSATYVKKGKGGGPEW
jgi:hypothetical protein